MKTRTLGSIFGYRARDQRDPHEDARARYLSSGMTRDMADLLVTMLKLSELPTHERLTTHRGRILWRRYLSHCTRVDRHFEAIASNPGLEEFRTELNRLAAAVQGAKPERTEVSSDSR